MPTVAASSALAHQRTATVASGDAVLHVADAGPEDAPPVLFLHGYPDDHRTWDLVRAQLADRYRVIAFDLRGMARSRVRPTATSHRLPRLLDDIDAVASHVLGADQPGFHLVGHDWGSIIGWSYMTDPNRHERVLSWTSISATHLGVVGPFMKKSLRDPQTRRAALVQARHSAYIAAFQLPRLPERVWDRRAESIWRRTMTQGGVPNDDPMLELDRSEILSIGIPGLQLYRQNIRPGRTPGPPTRTSILAPVRLVIATEDPFVSPALARASGSLCADHDEREIAAGHWVQRSHPTETSTWIAELVERSDDHHRRRCSAGSAVVVPS